MFEQLEQHILGNDTFFAFFVAANALALTVWVASLVTHNLAQIDRVWPIAPVAYAWAFLYHSLGSSWTMGSLMQSIRNNHASSPLRLMIMTLLITMWGARLAFAFWRRGFFTPGVEDHRWQALRTALNYPARKLPFHLVNAFGIALAGNWLLLGLTLPMWLIQNATRVAPINWMDGALVLVWMYFFGVETIADEQQWAFQARKAKFAAFPATTKLVTELKPSEVDDVRRGFNIRGLFAFARHPNYFGELGQWWCIYAFTVSALPWHALLNYSIAGALGLTALVHMTTPFTEKLQRDKYVEYPAYADAVSRILPACCSKYEPGVPLVDVSDKESSKQE